MDRDLQMDWYFEFSVSKLSSMSYSKQHRYRITLDLLQSQFDQPIAEAAKYFGVRQSLFNRICRQHGIKKWPQRTIRSLKRHIEVLNEQLKTTRDSRKREKIVAEIHAHQSRIDAHYTKQPRFDPRTLTSRRPQRRVPLVHVPPSTGPLPSIHSVFHEHLKTNIHHRTDGFQPKTDSPHER